MARLPSTPRSAVDASPSADAPMWELVQVVLREAKVKTYVCSRQRGRQGYVLPCRTVPDYNLIYITLGKVEWVIAGQSYLMQPGEMVLVPPGVPHHGLSHTKRFDLTSLHMDVTLPGGQDVLALLIPPTHQAIAPDSRLAAYLAGFTDEFTRADRFMLKRVSPGWGRMIAMELLWHDARQGLLTHRPIEPFIAQVLQELQRRISQPVTLESLAQWSGYSPQHLNRVFRRVLGVTPLQHLTRIRLDKAVELLADDQLTVHAVAQAVGLDDPYYFSRLFKQHYGLSPANYRQSLNHH